MPTEVAEAVSEKTHAAAMKIEKEILELAGEFGSKGWRIGLLIDQVSSKETWKIRGFESETAYRLFLNIGRSTWYRTKRLTQEIALPLIKRELLTRKSLDRLTLENADHLLKLPERKRFSESWVEKALTMKEDEFCAAVDQVVENGGEEVVESSETRAILRFHCTSGQKDVILDGIHGFAKKHGIPVDEEARSLELLIAEVKGCQSCGWE